MQSWTGLAILLVLGIYDSSECPLGPGLGNNGQTIELLDGISLTVELHFGDDSHLSPQPCPDDCGQPEQDVPCEGQTDQDYQSDKESSEGKGSSETSEPPLAPPEPADKNEKKSEPNSHDEKAVEPEPKDPSLEPTETVETPGGAQGVELTTKQPDDGATGKNGDGEKADEKEGSNSQNPQDVGNDGTHTATDSEQQKNVKEIGEGLNDMAGPLPDQPRSLGQNFPSEVVVDPETQTPDGGQGIEPEPKQPNEDTLANNSGDEKIKGNDETIPRDEKNDGTQPVTDSDKQNGAEGGKSSESESTSVLSELLPTHPKSPEDKIDEFPSTKSNGEETITEPKTPSDSSLGVEGEADGSTVPKQPEIENKVASNEDATPIDAASSESITAAPSTRKAALTDVTSTDGGPSKAGTSDDSTGETSPAEAPPSEKTTAEIPATNEPRKRRRKTQSPKTKRI